MISESNQTDQDIRNIRAAALKYNATEDRAPVVVAAGGGYIAGRILEIAEDCGISIYHDESSAALLSRLKLGQEIPPEFFQMVVDIYVAILSASDALKENMDI